ncbi:Adenylate cyclase [Geitlerinema sp. FC II]|nr:Adenylate cyclase [Geitlerinema sp. FC II]
MSSMSQLVVLKLTGDLARSGFHVSLEVGSDNQRPISETTGFLPPSTLLAERLQQHWSDTYRRVGSPWNSRLFEGTRGSRIRPKRITYNGAIERLNACRNSAKLVETQFHNWLSSESFREVELRLREALSLDDEIRILVRSDCLEIRKLPWHLWDFVRRYPNAEVSLSPVSVATPHQSADRWPTSASVKILAILGHGDGIDLECDREFLERLEGAEVTFLVEPRRQDIHDRLWDRPWDIIFFAGHSETEGETGKIYINPEESLSLEDLWYGLRKAVDRGLKLAIFNSCDGLGLARGLDDCHIPQMVVMRELVPDRVAQAFLKYFLEAFSQGVSLYRSVRTARERLQALEDRFPCASWLPAIVQHPHAIPPRWTDLRDRSFSLSSPESSPPSNRSPATPTVRKVRGVVPLLGFSTVAIALYCIVAPPLAGWLNRLGEAALGRDWHAARRYFEWSLRVYPYSGAASNNLGFIAEDMREIDLARTYYRRAMWLGNAAACNNMAYLDLSEGQPERAARLLKQCRRMAEPDNTIHQYSILKNQGRAQYELGRYEAAIDYFSEAVRLLPDEGIADCWMARTLEVQHRDDEAIASWSACFSNVRIYYYEEEQWKRKAEIRLREAGLGLPPS